MNLAKCSNNSPAIPSFKQSSTLSTKTMPPTQSERLSLSRLPGLSYSNECILGGMWLQECGRSSSCKPITFPVHVPRVVAKACKMLHLHRWVSDPEAKVITRRHSIWRVTCVVVSCCIVVPISQTETDGVKARDASRRRKATLNTANRHAHTQSLQRSTPGENAGARMIYCQSVFLPAIHSTRCGGRLLVQ